jgi:hypothetical protein
VRFLVEKRTLHYLRLGPFSFASRKLNPPLENAGLLYALAIVRTGRGCQHERGGYVVSIRIADPAWSDGTFRHELSR